MSDEKYVVLGRPHPFIVDAMKTFLKSAGYTPKPMADESELNSLPLNSVHGLVVSTSMTTNISEIEQKIRAVKSNLPVLVETLLDAQKAKPLVEPIVKAISSNAKLYSLADYVSHQAHLGTADAFLVLNKDELSGEQQKQAIRAIQQHF